jgi:hypothetical protein
MLFIIYLVWALFELVARLLVTGQALMQMGPEWPFVTCPPDLIRRELSLLRRRRAKLDEQPPKEAVRRLIMRLEDFT